MTSSANKLFYGWKLVALTFYSQFIVMGTVFYSHGILLKPMIEDIGGSRLGFGMAFLVYQTVFAFMGLLLGQMIVRVSMRKLMLVGAGILSCGFYMLSEAESLLWFYLSFGVIIAAGGAMLGGITNTVLVSNWFEARRGTALGISQFGVSASGMVMAYVTPWLIELYGWRDTTALFALAPILLVAPFVWLLVIDKPEDRGLGPDGMPDGQPSVAGDQDVDIPVATEREWHNRDALASVNFWLIVLTVGFCFAVLSVVVLRLFPHVTDQGYSLSQASLLVSLMAGFAACGKPLCGWLADKISAKLALAAVIVLQIIGVLLIIIAESYPLLLFAVVCYGLGYGGLLPLWGVLIGAVFGRLSFARVMGLMTPVMLPFQVMGVPFADWVFDKTGSYTGAFLSLSTLCVVAIVLLLFIKVERADTSGSASL